MPRLRASPASMMTTAAAPSESCDEFPAVIDEVLSSEPFERVVGPIPFVPGQRDELFRHVAGVLVLVVLPRRQRNDLRVEPPGGLGRRDALLRLQRVLVLRLTRDLVVL